jgi:hypothetical protein
MYSSQKLKNSIFFIVSTLVISHLTFAQNMWVETTQEDFRDGVYERNLYASHLGGGAVEYAPRFDLNNDGYIDLFTADRSGPNAKIYWGDASGYSSTNVTLFPSGAAGNCDAADLNGDGYADFVVMHFRNWFQLSIYWGTPTGPSSTNATHISFYQEGENCFIADFNKDGYLDIVNGASIAGYGAVFWGSATGFDFNNRTDLPQGIGQHNIEVADFDKDNWLDIMYPEYLSSSVNRATIFWGSETGFSPQNHTYLPGIMCLHGLSAADLDGNEYLDVILTFWYDPQSYIYWGSETGYSTTNMQVLNPGYCYGGSTVADMNTDGYLDIVYHRGGYGSHQQGIYWGSASGYSDGNVTWFGIAVEASGGTVGDFNYDGNLDIFTNVVTPGSESYIFWGPDFGTNTALPVNDDHHGMFREIGNVYTREYAEYYLSSVFNADEVVDWGIIEWDDSIPLNTDITMSVRSGNIPAPDITWSNWYSIANGENIPDTLNAQYLQYRAMFTQLNPAHQPVLYEVRLQYGPLMQIRVEPDCADSTLPAQPIQYVLDVINIDMGLDTVDLDYQHTTTWQIQLLDSTGVNPLIDHNNNSIVDVIIDSDDTVGIVLEVTPPLTAQGGDIDSLTLVGTSSIIPTEDDTAYVYTAIQRLVSILIEPDRVEYTIPGFPAQFDLWAINAGTNTDTIDLSYVHNQPWGVSLVDSTGSTPLQDHNGNGLPDVSVNSYDSVRIYALVYPPGSAQQGDSDTLVLTGRSSLNNTVTDDALLLTVIEMGSILIFPDQSVMGQPDSWVNIDQTCRNTQSFTDTVDLALIDQYGWTYQLLDSAGNALIDNNGNGMVDIPGIAALIGEADFTVNVHIPPNTPLGTIDTLELTGYSHQDTTIQDSSILVVTVGTYAHVLIGPNQADSGAYGDTIDYVLQVQNLGTNTDTIDIELLNTVFSYTLLDMAGMFLIDHNNNGMVDIGGLAPYQSESLIVRTVITSAQPGLTDTVIVRAHSNVNTAVFDDAELRTQVTGSLWALSLEPDQTGSVEVGQTIVFDISAVLSGSSEDIVDVWYDTVVGEWNIILADTTAVPLTDTDLDGLIDLGYVTPAVARRFQVLVQSPGDFNLAGQPDTLTSCSFYVHGRCSISESITDSARITIQLIPPFDVHNFRNPFRTQTQFIFSLPKDGRVILEVYTRNGELVNRLIDNHTYTAGVHYFPWNGTNHNGERLAPGAYIYFMHFRAQDGEERTAKKKAVIIP